MHWSWWSQFTQLSSLVSHHTTTDGSKWGLNLPTRPQSSLSFILFATSSGCQNSVSASSTSRYNNISIQIRFVSYSQQYGSWSSTVSLQGFTHVLAHDCVGAAEWIRRDNGQMSGCLQMQCMLGPSFHFVDFLKQNTYSRSSDSYEDKHVSC